MRAITARSCVSSVSARHDRTLSFDSPLGTSAAAVLERSPAPGRPRGKVSAGSAGRRTRPGKVSAGSAGRRQDVWTGFCRLRRSSAEGGKGFCGLRRSPAGGPEKFPRASPVAGQGCGRFLRAPRAPATLTRRADARDVSRGLSSIRRTLRLLPLQGFIESKNRLAGRIADRHLDSVALRDRFRDPQPF